MASIIQTKSKAFAIKSILLYKELTESKEFILSKQFLRSATSMGANVCEATNAQSSKDFIHKLAISQKECDETIYWLELMKETQYISEIKFKEMEQDAVELLKMIRSSIITIKKKMNIESPTSHRS